MAILKVMTRPPSRPIALWLFVVVALLASAIFVGWRLLGPSDGAQIAFYGDAWTTDGVRVERLTPALDGLQSGDHVLAIGGQLINRLLDGATDPSFDRATLAPGEPVIYTVERGGEIIDVAVLLQRADAFAQLERNWSNLVVAGLLLVLGLYVLLRRPELSAARALAIALVAMGASTLPWTLGLYATDLYLGWPYALYVLSVSPLYMLLWPAGAIHLPLALMPGRGPSGPSRRMLVVVYGVPLGGYAVLLLTSWLVAPSHSAWVAAWPLVQGLIIVPSVLLGLTLAAVAYRRAGRDVQRQLRWALAGAGFAAGVSMALMFVPQMVLGQPLLPWSAIGLIALPFPIGLALAIVRHQLFDIEIVINRTLVYGGVTLAIILVYASTVLVVGAIVPQGAGLPGSLLATGLAAVAALPARDLLQRTVNRLMYGDRDDPYRALARLSRRLESTLEPMAIPEAIVESVAEALRLPYVALEIGSPDLVEMSASRGEPVEQPLSLSLVYGAEPVGRLLFAARAPGEALTASDRRLLDDLARGAGAAVHSVRLTLDVIRSRERLVAAREEERRRIRRDLHDGLGPTLAAIGMRAELVADSAARDTPAAEELRELTGDVRRALAEVRRLVEGLRPPALDELGLVGAISLQAERLGRPPAFDISSDEPLPELPAAIEVAAYRIAVEAMTNAVRHAAADHCRVTVTVDRSGLPALRVEITDDGQGLPEQPRAGIGLASMRERTAEVGGSLSIGPAPTGGTRVGALLPLQAAGTR